MRNRFSFVPGWAVRSALIAGEALGLVVGIFAIVVAVTFAAAIIGR